MRARQPGSGLKRRILTCFIVVFMQMSMYTSPIFTVRVELRCEAPFIWKSQKCRQSQNQIVRELPGLTSIWR
jgi:hypothetical protein